MQLEGVLNSSSLKVEADVPNGKLFEDYHFQLVVRVSTLAWS
jgi:hypothetical protein